MKYALEIGLLLFKNATARKYSVTHVVRTLLEDKASSLEV